MRLSRVKKSYKKPTDYFDVELAEKIAALIIAEYPEFDKTNFIHSFEETYSGKALKKRVEILADQLHMHLPDDYRKSTKILMSILGPENEFETGMFTNFYWLMPVAKYVEKYGLNDYETSISAIEEITKRNTGEYAIRPFIIRYPAQSLEQMRKWALSENFHLRRLASEGIRPKLPWAAKLDLFIDEPEPVFEILDILKEDHIHFVKKSVANHLCDYVKVNRNTAIKFVSTWEISDNEHTQWILQRVNRQIAKSAKV